MTIAPSSAAAPAAAPAAAAPASPASPAAPSVSDADVAPKASMKSRIFAFLAGDRAAKETAEAPAPVEAAAERKAEKVEAPAVDADEPEVKDEAGEKFRALQAEVSTARVDLMRREAAIEIIVAENQRLLAAWREGTPYDEKGETIRQYEIAELARQKNGEIQTQHDEDSTSQVAQEAQAEVSRSVRAEVSAALAQHPILHRAELIAACRRPENLGRNAADVAASLEEDKFAIARQRSAEKPRAPATVKASGGGNSQHSYPNNAKGMNAFLSALKQSQG